MKKKLLFSYPVISKKWQPGSYQDRHYGIYQNFSHTDPSYHTGTDIGLPVGEPVFAVADGAVVKVEHFVEDGRGYGRLIAIKHRLSDKKGDEVFSVYLHLSKRKTERMWVGRSMKRGECIGYIGADDENGDGLPHLHFGVYRGMPPDVQDGVYPHAFVGYGRTKDELMAITEEPDYPLHLYRTTVSQGGNAIDPVKFLEDNLAHPHHCPAPLFHRYFGEKGIGIIAPGGDRYEWKEAETEFKVPKNGKYIIKVTASAKDEKQNGTTDDDDLRLEIDGHKMDKGPHEGFEIASSWNGASLRGHEKEIYYIVDLDKLDKDILSWFGIKKTHTLRFFADGRPTLKSIEVYPWSDSRDLTIPFFETSDRRPTDRNGIPWKSFVFLSRPKEFHITARCLSKKIKKNSGYPKNADDDNIKIIVNDHIEHNKRSKSKRFINYPLAGDQMQGAFETATASGFTGPLNTIQLWADEQPFLEKVEVKF